RRVMGIDNRSAGDRVVRNVEVSPVVGSEPRRAPVDFHDFGEAVLDVEPVAHFVRPADLQRDAGDDSAEKILRREAKDDGEDARAGEKTLELRFGVVNNAQHDQERDKVNEKRNDLTEELGNRGLTFLFEVDVPEVTIEERHDESSSEEDGGGIDMFAPFDVHAVEKDRGVECQGETEELERNTEAHAGAPLQKPTDR